VFKLVREFSLVAYLMLLVNYPSLQMIINQYFTIAGLIIVGVTTPYVSKLDFKLDLLNEFTIFLINLHLFLFTPFVPSQDRQSDIGLHLICITVFLLVANLGPIVYS